MISQLHSQRAINRGRAQWRVTGKSADGRPLTAIYDHPHGIDRQAVRVVSVWSD